MAVTSGRKSKGREKRMSGRQRRRLRTRRKAERSPRKEASSVAETLWGTTEPHQTPGFRAAESQGGEGVAPYAYHAISMT